MRKMWSKDLPNVNIVFDKYKEVDSFFDPHRFLDEFDTEKYFEPLKDQKEKYEICHLREKPHLKFGPYRHTKNIGKSQDNQRISYFFIFYFFRATQLLQIFYIIGCEEFFLKKW